MMRTACPHISRNPKPSGRWVLELLWSLSAHRIALRYKETLFGFLWIFLQPVALTLIFTYIFHWFAHIPSGTVPYPLFSATGLIAWSLTALVVSASTQSLTSQAALLKRVALPRILLPLSVVISTLADLCVMSLLLVGLFFYYRHPVLWTAVVWVPFLLIVHLVLLTGIGCLLSLLNVFLKDIGHAIPSLLQLWFFASPVFYPVSMVPRQFRVLAQWNPMTGLIEGYRAVVLLGQPPPGDLLWPAFLSTAAVFIIGWLCFKRLEGVVADLL